MNNGGRPDKGFNSESSLAVLKANGTPGKVTKTLPNGVRIVNIELHKTPAKRTENGQVWFPKDWTDDDILTAATKILNDSNNKIIDDMYTGNYKCHGHNIRLTVYVNNPGTIFPDKDNQPL